MKSYLLNIRCGVIFQIHSSVRRMSCGVARQNRIYFSRYLISRCAFVLLSVKSSWGCALLHSALQR